MGVEPMQRTEGCHASPPQQPIRSKRNTKLAFLVAIYTMTLAISEFYGESQYGGGE